MRKNKVNGISIYENVLEEQFCKFLLKNSLQELSSGKEFSRSNLHWEPNIVKASTLVLVRDYNEILKKMILSQLLKKSIIDNCDYVVMNYAWSKLSYIPWHNDGHRKTAITIYLNEIWDENWGGIFLYKDKKTNHIKGYIPKFNTAIKNDSHVIHSTTMVSLDAEVPRITIQIFPKD
jgi:Rps23 Pro-64 3,4-dihydroxylase Tpa1-like proline 4-hydroxylase